MAQVLTLKRSCQLTGIIQSFLSLIPENIVPEIKQCNSDFTRNRKLPFPKLITLILSFTPRGKSKGVDIKSGEFFRNAQRSGIWPEAVAVHRSGISIARNKVPWTVFRDIQQRAVDLAYRLWPRDPSFLWHGMSVFAFDGSKYDLPATEQIREDFDPRSGLQYEGKGHYPQCLVTTAYDVFRRLPVARSVVGTHGSERDEVIPQQLFKRRNSGFILSPPSGRRSLQDREVGFGNREIPRQDEQQYPSGTLCRCHNVSNCPDPDDAYFSRSH